MAPAAAEDYCLNDPRAGKTVCVMDASSRVGSALVQKLLQRGYTVHAALHNPSSAVDVRAKLFREEGRYCCGADHDNKKRGCINNDDDDDDDVKKRLKVFKADPLDYGSIMDALKGCCGLFYYFKPAPLGTDPPCYDEHMAEAEVRAAHNVLEACAQTDTIYKVVFTSSATSVIWRPERGPSNNHKQQRGGDEDPPNPNDDLLVDERHWSDINFCRKYKLWHALSKTLAERTAWALAMDRGVDMVSINAGLLLVGDDGSGGDDYLSSIKNPYLKGAAEMYEDGLLVTVDLNYLIRAHVRVFEEVSSYGRYLCFNHAINCNEDVLKLASMLLPSSTPTTQSQREEDSSVYPQRINNQKLSKLMLHSDSTPRPPQTTE